MVLSCACASGAVGEQDRRAGRERGRGASLIVIGDMCCSLPGFGVGFSANFRVNSALEPHLCKASHPANLREKTSLDSPLVLVYGFAAGGLHPFAVGREFRPGGYVESRKRQAAKAAGGPRIAAQEDDAASLQPVGDARHRNVRAARPRRRDGGRRRQRGGDRQAARPRHRSRLSPAARALDLRHRHRKRRRQIRADAARAHADVERAELHAHVGGTAHRIQRRDLEPPRWRARRRHRVRGAEGQAAVQLAARQSRRRARASSA